MTRLGPEEPLVFSCRGETLLGLLHQPAAEGTRRLGVVIIVGGPQYRAGSHRQFLHLARNIAAAGHVVLRFDVRGMGDSTGTLRSFEQLGDDTGAAIDALMNRLPELDGVVLLGLCDGASAALLYLAERPDPRVQALCMMNPWVRSSTSQARTTVKHYYTRRLREPAFWAKLFKGDVAGKALRELLNNLRAAGKPSRSAVDPQRFQDRMALVWQRFTGPTFIALSGDDFTAKEFLEVTAQDPAWQGMWQRAGITRLDIPGADHTFSGAVEQPALQTAVVAWLASLSGRTLA